MKLFGRTFEKDSKGKWTLPLSRGKKKDLCRTKFCKGIFRRDFSKDKSKARCEKCISRIHRANNLLKYAFNHVKDSAKKRNISFLLSLEDFEKVIEGTDYLSKKGRSRHALQLDRIDPERGYEVGNLQVITASENCSKDNNRWREKKPEPEFDPDNCPF